MFVEVDRPHWWSPEKDSCITANLTFTLHLTLNSELWRWPPLKGSKRGQSPPPTPTVLLRTNQTWTINFPFSFCRTVQYIHIWIQLLDLYSSYLKAKRNYLVHLDLRILETDLTRFSVDHGGKNETGKISSKTLFRSSKKDIKCTISNMHFQV